MFNTEILERINAITETEIEHMENEVGPLCYQKRLNETFFTNMYLKCQECLFDFQKEAFYLYESKTGLWRKKAPEFILNEIADFTREFCRQQKLFTLVPEVSNPFKRNCLENAKGIAGKDDPFFDSDEGFKVHCQNGVLEVSPDNQSWVLRGFSPDDLSRNRTEISYDPEAGIPNRFLNELLKPVLTADEIDILQMYVGQCLLGVNYSQKFLLITGAAGTGKSTLVEVIKKLVNPENATEFRAEHLSSRFEIGRYYDKTLLLGSDVSENFLNVKGIGNLKKLTGHDTLTGEDKGSNQTINIKGDFNVIITSNSLPAIRMENDSDAWRRRLLWIQYRTNPNKQKIANFAEELIQEEGSAIMNWALEGALKLYQNGKSINVAATVMEEIDALLAETDSVRLFVQKCVKPSEGRDITNKELFNKYNRYAIMHDLEPYGSQKAFSRHVNTAISQILREKNTHSIERNGLWTTGFRNLTAVVE